MKDVIIRLHRLQLSEVHCWYKKNIDQLHEMNEILRFLNSLSFSFALALCLSLSLSLFLSRDYMDKREEARQAREER